MSESERFGGISRLVGRAALERLEKSHVCVVGLGGVGSWAVEALARSGIGCLTLVDLDDVCASNTNRQIHALEPDFGKSKVDVMARRVRAINPDCQVNEISQFFTERTAGSILTPPYSYLFDAIDGVVNKGLLIAGCRARNIPIISAGASGGRRKPELVRVADLAEVTHDPLLQCVRQDLRRHFGFPKGGKIGLGIPCVYSPEPQTMPADAEPECGGIEPASTARRGCERHYGTAAFITGVFGLVGVAHIVNSLADAPRFPG